jgi:4-diphosphocytidyl-2-C-methyl-D-erythritol kinase
MTKRSYAKVNIFLKIAGKRDNYHELVSRFVLVKNLFDTISFEKDNCKEFTLEGNFGCTTQQNTIYKAYQKLVDIDQKVEEYFKNYKVTVNKNIPEFAGLGGGSSNCATFINMVNTQCELNLSKDQLSQIGATIGADVPFFIYEYTSANVTGIGEIVEKFEEDELNIETITPKILCNTGAIFTEFRENYYKEISKEYSTKLLNMKSIEILNSLSIEEANDLYLPSISCEPKLKEKYLELSNDYYFSGSGSSFFKIKKEQ